MRLDREEHHSLRGKIATGTANISMAGQKYFGDSMPDHLSSAKVLSNYHIDSNRASDQSLQMTSSQHKGAIPGRNSRILKRVDGSEIQLARRTSPTLKREYGSRPASSPAQKPVVAVSPPAAWNDSWVYESSEEVILEMPIQVQPVQFHPPEQKEITAQSAMPAKESAVVRSARLGQISRNDAVAIAPAAVKEIECPICHGAGYVRRNVPVGHPTFGKIFPCECKKTQLEQQRRAELWKLSQLSAFEEMRFDTFNPRIQGVGEAYQVAQEYAADPSGWLVLGGPCGSGKTHLAAAIANQQFESGTLILFSVVPILLDHLRSTFAPSSEITYDVLFDKVLNAGLLVLDDLGAEHTTAWAQEKLFQILNFRYMYRMPTVITTNIELLSDLDDRVRSRLTDISLVRYVQIRAQDYRPRNVPHR